MLARLARRTRRTVRLLSDDATPAVPPQRIVVAVGGNALQRRGDRLTIENMLKAAKQMVRPRRPVVFGVFSLPWMDSSPSHDDVGGFFFEFEANS